MSTVYQKNEEMMVKDLIDTSAKKLDFDRPRTSLNADSIVLQTVEPAKSQVICIASGKGGTGKTMIATNLSVLFAKEGLNVTLIDADFGLANSHLLLGIDPRYDIHSVLAGKKRLVDVIEHGPFGVKLVPGGSGFSELSTLDDEKFRYMIREMRTLEEKTEMVIIDLAAGIAPQVMRLLSASHEIIIVTTPEVTSLIDAYALIKSLTQICEPVTVQMIVNRAPDRERAVVAFQKIWSIVNKHLCGKAQLMFLGWLPQNWYVQSSIACRKPVVLKHPQSLAARSLKMMAEKLTKQHRRWKSRQIGRWGDPSYFAKLEQTVYVR